MLRLLLAKWFLEKLRILVAGSRMSSRRTVFLYNIAFASIFTNRIKRRTMCLKGRKGKGRYGMGGQVLGMCMHVRAEKSEKEDLIRIGRCSGKKQQQKNHRHDCICS